MAWQDKVAQELINSIRATLASENRNASGKTSDSLSYVVEGNEIQIWGLETFFYTENGRPKGEPPPVGDILQWTIDKGIRADDGNQLGLAFAIRFKIGDEGSPTLDSPNRGRMQPLERTLDRVLPRLIDMAAEGMAQDIGADVFNMVQKLETA